MDSVTVGVQSGPFTVVQVGPQFHLVRLHSRGERNRDGHGIAGQFIHIQLGGGVVGIQGAGGGGRNGEGGGGYGDGYREGKWAGRGRSLGGRGGGSSIVVNVGGACYGSTEGWGKIVVDRGAGSGRHRDRAFPDLNKASDARSLVAMRDKTDGLPGISVEPVVADASSLIMAIGTGLINALIKCDRYTRVWVERIAHSRGINAAGPCLRGNVPNVPQLCPHHFGPGNHHQDCDHAKEPEPPEPGGVAGWQRRCGHRGQR